MTNHCTHIVDHLAFFAEYRTCLLNLRINIFYSFLKTFLQPGPSSVTALFTGSHSSPKIEETFQDSVKH
jgi:hypothetical protein